MFKIIEIKKNKLTLKATDPSLKKRDLIEQLKRHELLLDDDFIISEVQLQSQHGTSSQKQLHIVFNHPSTVLRALYNIPLQQLTDKKSPNNADAVSRLMDIRLLYASMISESSCYSFDLKYIKAANKEWCKKILMHANNDLKLPKEILEELENIAQKNDTNPLHQPIYILCLLKIHDFLHKNPLFNSQRILFNNIIMHWKKINVLLARHTLQQLKTINNNPLVNPPNLQNTLSNTTNTLNFLINANQIDTNQIDYEVQSEQGLSVSQLDPITKNIYEPQLSSTLNNTKDNTINEEQVVQCMHELIQHKARITIRCQKQSWFQNDKINTDKLKALDNIIASYKTPSGLTTKDESYDWIKKTQEQRALLSSSSSLLPSFLRGKVKTKKTLDKLDSLLNNIEIPRH